MMNEKVKRVLDTILERFKSGDIPEAVALSMFPIPDIPSTKWSLLNRTIMFFSGTADGRGYRQWQQANRYVKKGTKAFHILVPYIKKSKDENGEEAERLYGFGCKPVFRVEDTDGEPLEYENLELPEIPLLERAEEWGINVKAIPGNFQYLGYYSNQRNEIALATKEEKVFFHELAHAAHEKVKGNLKPGQDALQEIVAELSAQALCRIAGKQNYDSLGNSYKYIELYAEKIEMKPYNACLKVICETEKVLTLILQTNEKEVIPDVE
ncbi:antirestriction protein [Thermodesulfobacteriota bacterium]